jgi:acylglycerol lipase
MSTVPYTEAWLNGPSYHKFYTRTYTSTSPAKAAVVFIHGFIEHIGRFEHIFPKYQARGITVFAFDQRGFGRTAEDKERSKDAMYGKTNTVDALRDTEWAVGVAKEKVGDAPVFLMGHSMVSFLVLAQWNA